MDNKEIPTAEQTINEWQYEVLENLLSPDQYDGKKAEEYVRDYAKAHVKAFAAQHGLQYEAYLYMDEIK